MPLENNTGWIGNLAGQLAGQIGGGGDAGVMKQILDVLYKILNILDKDDKNTGDMVFPIYIGGELLDEIIVKQQQLREIRTNGRG